LPQAGQMVRLSEISPMKQKLFVVIFTIFLVCGRASADQGGASHDDKEKVKAIFALHDIAFNGEPKEASLNAYLNTVAEDIILMPHDGLVMEGKAVYGRHLREILDSGNMTIRHEVIEAYPYPEIVIVRGRAVGSFTPKGQNTSHTFETKNVFIFRRLKEGELKVWQIIFNHNPAKPASP
jgi:ketosteroid isomerase-like protein